MQQKPRNSSYKFNYNQKTTTSSYQNLPRNQAVQGGSSKRASNGNQAKFTKPQSDNLLVLFFQFLAFHFTDSFKKSKLFRIVVIALALFLILFIADSIINGGKIYAGVYVQDCDLGGKTVEEAQQIISETYSPQISNNKVVICADEYTLNKVESGDIQDLANCADLELLEIADTNDPSKSLKCWTTSAQSLNCVLDSNNLATEAFEVGRSDGGFIKRLGAMLFSCKIPINLIFDESSFNSLYSNVNSKLCTPVRNASFFIDNDLANLIESQDGTKIDTSEFSSQLCNAFIAKNPHNEAFKVNIYEDRASIHNTQAQNVCDCINSRVSKGLRIT
ncbi:MAG: peptidoglycan binding domain-containing protein, partial [Enterococcus sp.]|nr:peptidoglycan binding domain-containing protein [Enterococcus sp.]